MEYMESQMQRELERSIHDMNDLPAKWAVEKALKLMEYGGIPLSKVQAEPDEHYEVIAFARYIAEHEEAPVDPCVVEGRKLVAETQHDCPDSPWHVGEAEETLAGRRDYTLVVKAAIEGVRRGIEIGKGQP